MLMQFEQERIIGDIFRRSLEAVSLDDFNKHILPSLDQLLDTSRSLLYRCDEKGEMIPLGGSVSELVPEYKLKYQYDDPIFGALRRISPKIQQVSQLAEWKEYLTTPVYQDFTHPNEMDDFYHIVLEGERFQNPGMFGILLARTTKQAEYEERDGLGLAQVYPALEALVRRIQRLGNELNSVPFMETLLDQKSPNTIAMDQNGRLLWASTEAMLRLAPCKRKKEQLPELLVEAVRTLGTQMRQKNLLDPPLSTLVIPQPSNPPLKIELRVSRTRSGEPFVIAELICQQISSPLKQQATKYQLTTAETEILQYLGFGLTDREIAKHLFVSLPTVRTHVGHVLAKLGVPSRVHAALLCHGITTPATRN